MIRFLCTLLLVGLLVLIAVLPFTPRSARFIRSTAMRPATSVNGSI